jgi:hypothetical protein
MKSIVHKQFRDCFDVLPANIRELARSTFALWQSNPRHPSLHFKSVHTSKPLYSVRVGMRWRALGLLDEDTMTWFWIGTHAEYDRIIRRF